jgi:thioredoxin-like negative regulator of GroEL
MDGIYFLEDWDVVDNCIVPLPDDRDKYSLVLTFAHWCHNCAAMKKVFEQIMPIVQQQGKVRLYAMNGTGQRGDPAQFSRPSEQSLMKRWPQVVAPHKFQGFPSVYLFDKDGKVMKSYEGARTAEAVMQFLDKHT